MLVIYKNDTPIGFAILLKNADYGYVCFIAIDKHIHSKGYGGAAIKKIISSYSQLQIIL